MLTKFKDFYIHDDMYPFKYNIYLDLNSCFVDPSLYKESKKNVLVCWNFQPQHSCCGEIFFNLGKTKFRENPEYIIDRYMYLRNFITNLKEYGVCVIC